MTQLDLLARPCTVPTGGQLRRLWEAFRRGERLTELEATLKYRVGALSQRCGDLKHRFGWPMRSEWVKTEGGALVKRHYMEAR